MKIKEGFNGKETEIKVYTQANGSIELWITQLGISNTETLSYLTADELLALYKEVKIAGKDLFD